MTPTQLRLYQAALWSMLISAAAVVVSIAVSQIFLGLALATLVGSRAPLRFPPFRAPLLVFMGLTIVSLLASGHPAGGLPQIKKFFVYSVLLAAYTVFREAKHARWLAGGWFATASANAVRSLVQFGHKVEAARAVHQDFYQSYVGERITGFLGHWMTFSEVEMLVLLVLLSWLFFSTGISRRLAALEWACAALLLLSVVVSFTRSIWLATMISSGYLVWQWHKRLLVAAPVLLAAALIASPGAVRRRVESMASANSDTSTSARVIMWRTGWRMIEAHPLLGLGPERVGPEFHNYQPAEVTKLPVAYYGHLHNLYIHYAAERGVPALLALLWLLGLILRDHVRALRRAAAEDRFILYAAVAGTIGIIVGAFFEVNLGDSEVLTIFLALISLGYAAVARSHVTQAASPR